MLGLWDRSKDGLTPCPAGDGRPRDARSWLLARAAGHGCRPRGGPQGGDRGALSAPAGCRRHGPRRRARQPQDPPPALLRSGTPRRDRPVRAGEPGAVRARRLAHCLHRAAPRSRRVGSRSSGRSWLATMYGPPRGAKRGPRSRRGWTSAESRPRSCGSPSGTRRHRAAVRTAGSRSCATVASRASRDGRGERSRSEGELRWSALRARRGQKAARSLEARNQREPESLPPLVVAGALRTGSRPARRHP